jgi:hypothetical protein
VNRSKGIHLTSRQPWGKVNTSYARRGQRKDGKVELFDRIAEADAY